MIRAKCWFSVMAAALTLSTLIASPRPAAAVDLTPRILLHARTASTSQPCQPSITGCGAAITGGILNLSSGAGDYFVFLLAGRFDPSIGARAITTGLYYDLMTLEGVDIYSWHLCADLETPSTTEWYRSNGSNTLSWNAEHCRQDSLAVGGYFYLTAYTPGEIAMVAPEGGAASVTLCNDQVVTVPVEQLGYVGFGSRTGCNPCNEVCHFVPVETITWGRLKTLIR